MLFNSYIFIFIFLPIALGIYFILQQSALKRFAPYWLIGSSLIFYGYWNIIYLPLLIGSVVFNFLLGQTLQSAERESSHKKRTLFIVGIIANIALLSYFKYMDFFIENFNVAFDASLPLMHLALPLAISFFTLQQVAYLVDSYEGLVEEKSFTDYALFVTFFPQLIAGPIVHHAQMMPQFIKQENRLINYENIAKGLLIFSIGLFKKVVIADTLAIWVGDGFDVATSLNFIEAWLTSLAYTFQIYFDFSGYTDMAIGAALLFNIKLPQNFNSPYKATGIIDYWQRWHMTLTTFITTYVYTPILRSFARIDFTKAMIATFLAMFISGLWHGAGWTYIVWGILHGVALVVNHFWNRKKYKMPTWLAWFITFQFINITGIFFRAHSLDDAFKVLEGMVALHGVVLPNALHSVLHSLGGITYGPYLEHLHHGIIIALWIVLSTVLTLGFKNSQQIIDTVQFSKRHAIFAALLFFSSLLFFSRATVFLYFNF